QPFGDFIHDLAIVLLISLPFFVFFRFGGMPRAKGLFRAKVSIIKVACFYDIFVINPRKMVKDFFVKI
uniref:hypothetical protein n=1 Tax=Acinetobacter baumannii TaxID=470 RepID=UPI001BC88F48